MMVDRMGMAAATAIAVTIAAAIPRTAASQVPAGQRELVGIVRDTRGIGIEGAVVEIPGGSTRTDAKGTFRLFTRAIDTVTISIRRPGFTPIEAVILARDRQWDSLVVELEPLGAQLPAARIEEERVRRRGLQGFYERQERNVSGLFVTRGEIAARNTLRLSDVVHSRRGVQLVRIRGGFGVRFASQSGSRRNCTPDMWIDGQLARSMELDDIPANAVEGLELYDTFASIPADFTSPGSTMPCGAIVVWTRPPGTRRP